MSLTFALLLLAAPQLDPKEVFALLRSPAKVESFAAVQKTPSRFEILPRPQAVDKVAAFNLVTAILEQKQPLGGKACGFQPVVAFRFSRANKTFDLLICFSCQQVLIRPAESEGMGIMLYFDDAAERILSLTRTARPDDPRLKDLK